MPAEQFCLRWNNHHPNLITVFSTLLQNDQMVDVTLISENREIHAHKIILTACSPFFQVFKTVLFVFWKTNSNIFVSLLLQLQNIFLRNSCIHPVIVLTGIKYVHTKSLIDFIYNGEVNIHQDHLAELLRVASILKIKGLDEVASNETSEILKNPNINDPLTLNTTAEANTLTTQTANIEEITKREDVTVPSTSDQTKSIKKRKSVTFSDTPEIVWGQLNSNLENCQYENSGNGKRKLRSLTDICSITKIKKENEQSEFDSPKEVDKSNKNELFVSIDPHSLYTSIESGSDGGQVMESPLKKQRISSGTSRKMIRKNENFLRALEAVKDLGMGFCKAAKIYGVNNRTLWLEYQKLGYPMRKNNNVKSR